jgi:predicted transcriptional regulator
MMMRTTVTLDDDVAAQLERARRESGKGFKQALNDALRDGLARRRGAVKLAPFIVHARSLGLVPGLDYSNAGELLETGEGPDHR